MPRTRWRSVAVALAACSTAAVASHGHLVVAARDGDRNLAQTSQPVHPATAFLDRLQALRRKMPPKDILAELARMQPEIEASGPLVRARALQFRGLMLRAVGDLPAAERAGLDARALAAGAREGAVSAAIEFDALILLANIATDRGDPDNAARRLAEAAVVADAAKLDQMRAIVRLEQGRIALQRGRGRDGLGPLAESIDIAAAIGVTALQIQALTTRSAIRLGLADYDGALADAEMAYKLSVGPTGAPSAQGAFGLAQVVSQIGDLERGVELYSEAIAGYERVGVLVGVSLGFRQRMDVHFALEDYDAAAADGERARELFAKTGAAGQEPALFARMALIEARRSRPESSAAYYQLAAPRLAGALPLVRTIGESDLASSLLSRGQYADAVAKYGAVLSLARSLGERDREWRALNGLGRAELGRKNLMVAAGHFEAAIAVIERIRRTLPEPGLRADYIAERLAPYDGLIATELGRSTAPGDSWVVRALETAERARGRALSDLLAESQSRATEPAVARIRAQEAAFGTRLSDLQRALAGATSEADRRRHLADIARAEREYETFVVRIRRETPQYAALAHPRASTIAEIRSRLAPADALVSYWVGRERSVVWVVTRTGLSSRTLPGRADLDRDVARFRAAIAAGDVADVQRRGAAIHRTLLDGIDYGRIRRLVIVPDGPLWRLPFPALSPDAAGQWLAHRAAVSVVPSATLLAALGTGASTGPRQPGLIFGLEDVPPAVRALRGLYDERLLPTRRLAYAGTETSAVARLTGADPRTGVFLNDRAQETAFKRAAAVPYRVVHVAAHAMIDDRVPRRTALVLGPSAEDDGLLQLNEIATLTLDADLVVLSTCESHAGRTIRGEGLASLSRAFMHSGARAVTASLWPVVDVETSRLMTHFYTALGQGVTADEALRRAQLKMIETGGPSALPANWAAFVVMGRADRAVLPPNREARGR